jgi:tetratricopeptide (TPR) repeat protein
MPVVRLLRASIISEKFRTEIELARIYRIRGQYDLALAELDKLAKTGDGTGMAYHYHRGWILRLAGRYDDAIAELSAGLQDQPDYSGALAQRACIFARSGRLKEALADWQGVLKYAAQWGSDTPLSPGARYDGNRNLEVENDLGAAYARNGSEKTEVACTGFWDWGENYRERSALLPQSISP